MTRKWNSIGLISCLLTLASHFYLTLHYYQLKYGLLSEPSVCNVNSFISCDAVTASPYSSIAGVPLSLLGFATHLILLVLFMIQRWELSEKTYLVRKATWALSFFVLLMSLLMAYFSFIKIGQLCLFCTAAYILSIVTFWSATQDLEKTKIDFNSYIKEQKWISLSILSIPLLAFFLHEFFLTNYGLDNLDRFLDEKITQWQAAPEQQFTTEGLVLKPRRPEGSDTNSVKTLVEFADYRCPHCKQASPSLHAFVKAHPDVQLIFKPFPLDGSCNKAIPQGDGLSCRLAYLSLCAEQIKQQGWTAHEMIFAVQHELYKPSRVESLIQEVADALKTPVVELKTCMDSDSVQNLVDRTVAEGQKAQIRGTPAIFLQGRFLPSGQMLPILEKAYSNSQ